jgi:hypothetical protein
MTKKQKQQYRQTDDLRELLAILDKEKFKLDCGHHITFGEFLGNDLTVRNGKVLVITCTQCGY